MTARPPEYPAGSSEYVGITVTGDHDLSGDSIELAILPAEVKSAPLSTTWLAPNRLTHPATGSILGELFMGPLGAHPWPAAGRWRLWANVADSPEIPWVRSKTSFVVLAPE